MWGILLLAYWLLVSVLASIQLVRIFRKYEHYDEQIEVPEHWQSIIRKDYRHWNKMKIILGCFLILPFRVLFIIAYLFITCTLLLLVFLRGKFSITLQNFMNQFQRTYLVFFKIFIIDIDEPIQSFKVNTPIVIANHVNWFDVIYLLMRVHPLSVIAKQAVGRLPVAGFISKTINCIFIERGSSSERNKVVEQIKDRVEQFYEGAVDAFPLLIFPEGTTSNGRGLLTFKSGAFKTLSHITAFCLHYECENFGMGMEEISELEHIILMFCQRPKLRVKKVVFAPIANESPQDYAERCRSQMGKALNYPLTNTGFRDKQALNTLRKQNKSHSKGQ